MSLPKWIVEGKELLDQQSQLDQAGDDHIHEGWFDWKAENIERLLKECIRLHTELR